jgi:ATP adenylyltransferase
LVLDTNRVKDRRAASRRLESFACEQSKHASTPVLAHLTLNQGIFGRSSLLPTNRSNGASRSGRRREPKTTPALSRFASRTPALALITTWRFWMIVSTGIDGRSEIRREIRRKRASEARRHALAAANPRSSTSRVPPLGRSQTSTERTSASAIVRREATMELTCRFCDHLKADAGGSLGSSPWDHVVHRSDRFVVVPSKGALVPGWLLVVPKEHLLSMAEVTESSSREELDQLLSIVKSRVEAAFGPVTLFEHGATCPNSNFGCGIDHAHLHMAVLPFNLLEAVRRTHPEWSWMQSARPWSHGGPREAPYLALAGPDGIWLESQPPTVPRQFFRQMIAQSLGKLHEYDYDRFPRPENAALCVVALN